jgi:16S rRNA (cytosine967-C5)-methyltransferase
MRLPGHLSAAIEVLSRIFRHHLPATEALRDWGRTHRFAGSRDRQLIGTIVFDVLRHRASWSWMMDDDSPRALVLAWLSQARGLTPAAIERLVAERYGPGPLSERQRRALEHPRPLSEAPAWVRADLPEWLLPEMLRSLGDEETVIAHGRALASRAPLDIRVNTLKTTRADVAARLARFRPQKTPHSPWGLRFLPDADGRLPNVEAEMAHGLGHYEIQDEGSQIAAMLTGAGPGMRVLDLCAGGGGKTLAMAAMMENTGRIHAHDADRARLRPIAERLLRAGVANVEVIEPHMKEQLSALAGTMDIVLVDAPCTGTGTWRRRPDARWRLRPAALSRRQREQDALLRQAAGFLRPGGRLVYVTCSLLRAENEDRVSTFLKNEPAFAPRHWREFWPAEKTSAPQAPADTPFLRLSPLEHGTDGFFIAVLEHRGP